MVFANRRACIVRRTSWAARCALSAVLACSLAVSFALTGCSSEESGGSAEERALSYVSPYDWEHNLDTSNGRYVYAENGEVKSRIGVDVSDHQRNVNWAAVAQDGIDFDCLRRGLRRIDPFQKQIVSHKNRRVPARRFSFSAKHCTMNGTKNTCGGKKK